MGIAISWSSETQETPRVPSLGLPLIPVPRLLFAIPSASAQVSLAESQSWLLTLGTTSSQISSSSAAVWKPCTSRHCAFGV